ncbi:MAG: PhzF family phenazine biosynthesis protein [Candidatus Eremiobacteraeota bacterium]|nr:PhzF family phenazine biosynthesis protein [Candidatus Eremiobacteraeota bacterium]
MAPESERRYDYQLLDVFTKTRFEGNPLAVFPVARGLSDVEMQCIAGELNLSETVFLLEPVDARAAAKARIFTPRRELDFAGHPTIGTAFVVSNLKVQRGRFALEENVGLVPIDTDTDADGYPMFWLTTPPLKFFETVDPVHCAKLLGLSVDDITPECQPQLVSAGSPMLFVHLVSMEAVDRAAARPELASQPVGSIDSVGTYVFARKEPQSSTSFDVYARMFAPQTGIAEDPATGGAIGPLAGYLLAHGKLPRKPLAFTSEQGVKMGRRSLLHVRIDAGTGGETIKVGGCVVAIAHGTFVLNGA